MYTFSPNTAIESAKVNANFIEITDGLDTGILVANGSDWWSQTGTWTYASATSFTVPTADAARMNAGTRIKLTQTTVKYFTVSGVSGTTVTIDVTTDYTLINAAITAGYSSNVDLPPGFPGSFAWTPTWTNWTVGNGTHACTFIRVGKLIHAKMKLTWGNSTSGGTDPQFSLPCTASSNYSTTQRIGIGSFSGAGIYVIDALWGSTTKCGLLIPVTTGTYASYNSITATAPFNPASTGYIVSVDITYEAA
jgi:hypothetical protein